MGKEYGKTVYCHTVNLTYMQSKYTMRKARLELGQCPFLIFDGWLGTGRCVGSLLMFPVSIHWGSRSSGSGLVCCFGPIWFSSVRGVLGICQSFKGCALPPSLLCHSHSLVQHLTCSKTSGRISYWANEWLRTPELLFQWKGDWTLSLMSWKPNLESGLSSVLS